MALHFSGAPIRMRLWLLLRDFGKMTGLKRLENRGIKNAEYNRNLNAQRILINKGVILKGFVEIGPEVDLDRIESGAVFELGVKIFGEKTLFRSGTTLDDGTYRNIITGKNVNLGKGSYEDSVFLDRASVRYGSEIRKGTLYEEGANSGHIVGTKLTILGPYACLGSAINFCDIIDMGGSAVSTEDFLNFNEVGSGMIHYNFTPFGDKFSSYIGAKIPDAVFMNTEKTFVGGQAKLVAPNIVDEGVTIAAGTDLRKVVKPGKLLITEGVSSDRIEVEFDPKIYGKISDKLERTIYIIANLRTLIEWYTKVRIHSVQDDLLQIDIYKNAVIQIENHIKERTHWFDNLTAIKLPCSIKLIQKKLSAGNYTADRTEKRNQNIIDQELTIEAWKTIKPMFTGNAGSFFDNKMEMEFTSRALPVIKEEIKKGNMFINGIKKLPEETIEFGRKWLHEGFKKFCDQGYAPLKK